MTEAGIDYSGTISRELFVRSQRLHAGSARIFLSVVLVLAGLLLLSLAILNAPMSVLLPFVMAGALVPLLLILQRWQWQRLFKRSPYLHEPIEGVVSEQGLHIANSRGRSDLPWTLITKYKETSDLILLYQAPNMFGIVAKEFFDDDVDWQGARDLIHQQVKHG